VRHAQDLFAAELLEIGQIYAAAAEFENPAGNVAPFRCGEIVGVVGVGSKCQNGIVFEERHHLGHRAQERERHRIAQAVAYGCAEIGEGSIDTVVAMRAVMCIWHWEPAERAVVPPIHSVFSTNSTWSPSVAAVRAAVIPPAPLPSTSRSTSFKGALIAAP
jgi:hypothetical protein